MKTPNPLGVHRDVLVFLGTVLLVAAGSVIFIGVRLEDVTILFTSSRLFAWVVATALSVGLIFMLLYGRRRIALERNTLRTILECAGDGIFAIDRSFVISAWNPAAERITGIPADTAVGKPMRDVVRVFRERDRKEDVVFIEEAMLYDEQRTMSEPMYLLRPDGKEIPIADSAAPVRDGSGTVSGCVVVFRSVDSEKKREALHSEFAYASHQLRTPVTKALWVLEAAMEKARPSKEDVALAYAALRSIRKLVSSIVDVSELDQGMVRPRPAGVRLRETLESVIEELSYEVKLKGVLIDAAGLGDLAVKADARLLRRVMQEILTNAVMYNQSGGAVTVSARPEDAHILIEIRDAGIGIPEKEAPMVFTKFFRGSNFDTTELSGAGLGLNIARGYIELMHGRMWFTCKQNEGCTFSIQLPKAEAH